MVQGCWRSVSSHQLSLHARMMSDCVPISAERPGCTCGLQFACLPEGRPRGMCSVLVVRPLPSPLRNGPPRLCMPPPTTSDCLLPPPSSDYLLSHSHRGCLLQCTHCMPSPSTSPAGTAIPSLSPRTHLSICDAHPVRTYFFFSGDTWYSFHPAAVVRGVHEMAEVAKGCALLVVVGWAACFCPLCYLAVAVLSVGLAHAVIRGATAWGRRRKALSDRERRVRRESLPGCLIRTAV